MVLGELDGEARLVAIFVHIVCKKNSSFLAKLSSPAFWAVFRPQNWPHAAHFLKSAETEGYKKRAQNLGRVFVFFFESRLKFLFGQTNTIWQLANDAMVSLPAHKNPLLIKLDESSIFWFYGLERGHIIGPATRASRKEMQGAITFACFIFDQTDFQAQLPRS